MVRLARRFIDRMHLVHRAWRYRLRVERPEVRFLLAHLDKGNTAIDIGAHKGGFTYWMNRAVGGSGRVVAFEPIPHLAAYLRRIAETHPLCQVTVMEAALSDSAAVKPLFVPAQGYLGTTSLLAKGEQCQAVNVHTCRLDDFCAQRQLRPIHFIKCDVEGHELEVFQGAEDILREDRPSLLVECADWLHPEGQVGRFFSFLERFDYRGYFFLKGKARPLSEFRIAYQRQFNCVNFGFLPKQIP